jgi:hypothetical protein
MSRLDFRFNVFHFCVPGLSDHEPGLGQYFLHIRCLAQWQSSDTNTQLVSPPFSSSENTLLPSHALLPTHPPPPPSLPLQLLDEGSPFLELSPLAGKDLYGAINSTH